MRKFVVIRLGSAPDQRGGSKQYRGDSRHLELELAPKASLELASEVPSSMLKGDSRFKRERVIQM